MPEEHRHLTMWICVIITAALIFVGWIFSLKYNFQQIGQEMQNNVQKTPEQAQNDVQAAFQTLKDALQSQEAATKAEENATVAVNNATDVNGTVNNETLK